MSSQIQSFKQRFPNYNVAQQLYSIDKLINEIFTWRNKLDGEISDAEQDWHNSPGGYAEMAAESNTIDLYYESTYRDAAAVQAAVGAVTPFIEGFFFHAFSFLHHLHGDKGSTTNHERWKRNGKNFWNPRNKKGLIHGLYELRDALDLSEWLTDERLDTMALLFFFRNRSFHFAYEWPPDKINEFKKIVTERVWSDSVRWAKNGDTPWIAYLTDECLTRVLKTTIDIVREFDIVARDRDGVFRSEWDDCLPELGSK